MNENIFYIDAKTKIVDFLTTEFSGTFPLKLQNRFLNFFPQIANYEEEGQKYKPAIFFTNNIDAVVKSIPNATKIVLFNDVNENMFASRLKSLIPFCNLYWCVYVSINDDKIEYGIFRIINSIKDENLETILFKSEVLQEKSNKLFGIYVYAENTWTITMRSLKGRVVNVNFALDIRVVNNWEDEIKEFVDASFSKLRTSAKKLQEIKNMYRNIFRNVSRLVEGTICVVVDSEYKPDAFFEDGIWLTEPINLSKLFAQTNQYNEQKLTTMSDVFVTMLNFDGITVVDNMGQIRAYNVFIETNMKVAGNIIGGARKRAAYTIINSKRPHIIGVYFQSHEGEMFYSPVKK
ncbi:MAG: hypothetical protein NC133_00500 [Prevotella sp.]|nr:hypothetical protein [Prevotella sp.]